MPKPSHDYVLSDFQISLLNHIISSDVPTPREKMRAKIILYCAINSPEKMSIQEISELVDASMVTINAVRKQFCEEGIDRTVHRRPKSPGKLPPKLNLDIERKLIAMVSGPCPQGHKKWTLRLAAQEADRLGIVSVSHSTIKDVLKKYGIALS